MASDNSVYDWLYGNEVKSARFERYSLSLMKQKETKTADEFCQRITDQVDKCRIAKAWRATAIVDALMAGTRHQGIQKKLLQWDSLTWEETIDELKKEESKGIPTPSVKRQRQRQIGSH